MYYCEWSLNKDKLKRNFKVICPFIMLCKYYSGIHPANRPVDRVGDEVEHNNFKCSLVRKI